MWHNLKKGNKFTAKIMADKKKPSVVEVLNPKDNSVDRNLPTMQNPIHVINHLKNHLKFLQEQLHNAENGSYLLGTLSLGTVGLGVGAFDDREKDVQTAGSGKILGALIGGGIGLFFDNQRRKRDIGILINEIQITQDALRNAIRFQAAYEEALRQRISAAASQSTINLPKGVVTGEQVSDMNFKIMTMGKSYWGYLWGAKVQDPFYAIAYGLPSQGKSTFCIAFADYFNKNHGKTLFLASEQGIAQSLQGIINRTNSKGLHIDGNPKNKTVAQHIKDINSFQYKLVIIDSATHMNYTHEVIEQMRKATPVTSYLVILQSVKDGDFKGDNQWAHNCDIMVNINDGKAQVRKTRFGEMRNDWIGIPSLK